MAFSTFSIFTDKEFTYHQVPIILIVSWVNGIPMDLDLNLLETGSLVMTVFTTAFMLQDDKWHYLKGFNLTLCYLVIAVCFFTIKALPSKPIEQ
jgi:Ca2+:H+ antiporter